MVLENIEGPRDLANCWLLGLYLHKGGGDRERTGPRNCLPSVLAKVIYDDCRPLLTHYLP